MKPGTHRANRHTRGGSNLVVAQPLHLPQDERRFEFRRQLLQELPDKKSRLYGAPPVFHDGVKGCQICAADSKSVHAQPDDDTIQEAAEGAVVSKTAEVAKGLDEGVLRNVLGLRTIMD